MFALLILPILISGFIVLSIGPKERLRLHRYDGQLLYLKAAKIGLRYFLVVSLLVYIFKDVKFSFELQVDFFGFFPLFSLSEVEFPLVTHLSKVIAESQNKQVVDSDTLQFAWLLTLSFLTVLFSYICQYVKLFFVWIRNLIANRSWRVHNDIERISMLKKILQDSPIDYMFYESFVYRKAILVTLKSRKVYVGIVNKLAEPNESREPNQEISLVTAISGYRHKDSLEVKFTNNYEQTNLAEGQVAPEAIQILRLEQIDSVCWYNVSTFASVNGNMSKGDEGKSDVLDCESCKSHVKVKFGSFRLIKH
ncbi:TPA: hypothetical protein NJ393_003543 [Vibrio parahaemolyticus]|uniref:hypothetical protein n=1 Tax=Vibrio parahaemolyticus TaxID=670 RepID=UPI00193DB7E3|nr:hypothetical protein [Vibrio parahaemolyticus]EJG0941621.1 hypothetical protein [Vibrio parahaemolyticus O1]MBM4879001.1 hypothetical protein [Vibrio parahaemolyticus]HAS6891207.1 hypothetical protein [Vibrio parahaemolyticus]HAV1397031.1 hypothetical protein [Vibrio parahaemolyticus]HCE2477844.1 hypothetical protein [Vibrio parahaemolyticus]